MDSLLMNRRIYAFTKRRKMRMKLPRMMISTVLNLSRNPARRGQRRRRKAWNRRKLKQIPKLRTELPKGWEEIRKVELELVETLSRLSDDFGDNIKTLDLNVDITQRSRQVKSTKVGAITKRGKSNFPVARLEIVKEQRVHNSRFESAEGDYRQTKLLKGAAAVQKVSRQSAHHLRPYGEQAE